MAHLLFQAQPAAPVVGLDAQSATKIIFTLQQCTGASEDGDIARLWLHTLQLATTFHQRLLSDLDTVESNLSFWNSRLQEGSHVRFMLLQRGPAHFVRHLGRGIRRLLRWLQHMHAAASAAAQPGGPRQSGTAPGAGGAAGGPHHTGAPGVASDNITDDGGRSGPPTSATNKMQRRVLLLEALRNLLAETLAQVTGAARLLWLNAGASNAPPMAGHMLSSSPHHGATHQPGGAGSTSWAAHGQIQASASSRMLQLARDSCQEAASELLQLAEGLHERLRQLKLGDGGRSTLPEVAVTRMLTGCAALAHHTITAGILPPTLTRMVSMARPGRAPSTGFAQPHTTTSLAFSAGSDHSSEAGRRSTNELMNVREARPRQLHTNPLASQEGGPGSGMGGLTINTQTHAPPIAEERPSPRRSSLLPSTSGIGRGSPTAANAAAASSTSAFATEATQQGVNTNGLGTVAAGGQATEGVQPSGGVNELWRLLTQLEAALTVDVLPKDKAGKHTDIGAPAPTAATIVSHDMQATAAGTAHVEQPDSIAAQAAEWILHRPKRGKYLRAADALETAAAAARRAGPLAVVPDWARMPSWFQRRWVACTAAGWMGLWAGRWVWRHSPAGGSDDLVRWSREAWAATQISVKTHIVKPLRVVRDEFTHTFRSRPSIVSQQEFDADKQSLMRMLGDFERDVAHKHPVPAPAGASAPVPDAAAPSGWSDEVLSTGMTANEQKALVSGMHHVMASYEAELRDPLRNLLMGQLARSLLIQVQRLKLDTEAAMLELDQILKANELSISLVAAIPALAVTWGMLATLARWLLPSAPDAQRAAIPCRMALTAVERALDHLADQEAILHGSVGAAVASGPQPPPSWPPVSGSPAPGAQPVPRSGSPTASADAWLAAVAPGGVLGWLDAEGMVLFSIHKLYREALALYLAADTKSRHSEWPSLSADLSELTMAEGAWSRLRVLNRMSRNYQVFKR